MSYDIYDLKGLTIVPIINKIDLPAADVEGAIN
jgi:translation elongation factor EF-4